MGYSCWLGMIDTLFRKKHIIVRVEWKSLGHDVDCFKYLNCPNPLTLGHIPIKNKLVLTTLKGLRIHSKES